MTRGRSGGLHERMYLKSDWETSSDLKPYSLLFLLQTISEHCYCDYISTLIVTIPLPLTLTLFISSTVRVYSWQSCRARAKTSVTIMITLTTSITITITVTIVANLLLLLEPESPLQLRTSWFPSADSSSPGPPSCPWRASATAACGCGSARSRISKAGSYCEPA